MHTHCGLAPIFGPFLMRIYHNYQSSGIPRRGFGSIDIEETVAANSVGDMLPIELCGRSLL